MPEMPSMPSSEVNFKVQDEGRLAELGYTQELRREWSLLHNFGASFSIIVRPPRRNEQWEAYTDFVLLSRVS